MTPNAITLLFKEARDAFPPLDGKPMNGNLLSIRETLLPILMEVPYNQLGGVHSLTSLITEDVRYAAEHGGNSFKHPVRLPLYDTSIKDDATTVVCVRAEATHKARLNNYASFKVAERWAAKFLCEVVNEVWYNYLKDADTFYTKVTALKIISILDAYSGGLHAVDMISLRTNMHQYYVQVDGIPQYIIMLEDAQKKAKRAGMPIANVELVMMASAAVLAAQHFPHKVDNWEGLPTPNRTWLAWKTAFRFAHLKRQRQILASGGGGGTTRRGSRRAPCGEGRRSDGWRRHSTTLHSPQRTSLPCSSSSRRPIWRSRPPSACSPQPTKYWWMQRRGPRGLQLRGLPRCRRGKEFEFRHTPETTAGCMAIASARSTQVPPVPRRQRNTATMPQWPTPSAEARRTRGGTRRAPDGGGWRT
jgi:hypothetical protein